MEKITDLALLRQYAKSGSDEAFRLIVERHLGLVHGTAMRQLGHAHQADEVSHAVFLALAKKADALADGTVIAGWLFKATRFAAAKLARDEERRTRREKEAAMIHFESLSEEDPDPTWNDIAPHLNEALELLSPKDRDAILLRFFEQQSFAEVGRHLSTTEDAAKMRVSRALQKMRSFFQKRGLVMSIAALSTEFSANASAVGSDGLAETIAARVHGGSLAQTGAVLTDAILRHFWLLRMKFWAAMLASLLFLGAIIGVIAFRSGWFGRAPSPPSWAPPAR
jgi:RNA polymerase sigma factor (sigma-70 family)